ncbi:MAG: hypothetical protein ACM3PT_00340 [Deltaproteobacteria bacterium]
MLARVIFILIIASGTISCACKKKNEQTRFSDSVLNIERLACNKFNQDFEIQFNKKGDYALVHTSKVNSSQQGPDLTYFIYSLDDKKIIIEDSMKVGKILWSDKYSIIASEKETFPSNNTRSYKFNLKKRKYRYL